MSLKRHGNNNKPNTLMEQSRHGSEYPSREELISQLSQLRSSLDGAYETLDSLTPSTDPKQLPQEVIHKVADMVDIINGLHECEFELMDLLAKDSHVISPSPGRGGDNPIDNGDERLCDGTGTVENNSRSRAASQEDLSLYGAYAVSSSRTHKAANDLPKAEKSSDHVDLKESRAHLPAHERADYIKRLEEIQKVNERLVDRCHRLGLVLRCGFALDKNFSTKMKEVKDIIAAKEQAQKKILELKALMQQMTDEKLESDISLAKIENDESYGRPFRFESRLASRGASSVSPVEHVRVSGEEENLIKKPRSFFGVPEATEPGAGPDYSQFLRGLRQPFPREHGERESAFVPIHNTSHLDPLRDKNIRPANLEGNHHIDLNSDIKPNVGSAGLLRRVMEKATQNSQNPEHWDQQRLARSSSARSSLAPSHLSAGCTTLPNNLFRSGCPKSPPSMQSSSGIGSMNSRSIASLDNCRNDMGYMSCNLTRVPNRNSDSDDIVGQRGFAEGASMSTNNLNKSYRQPTRSSSFYSELDFRNQEFPSWDEDRIRTTPLRDLRSPTDFARILSSTESQQITDELNRVLRFRKPEDALPQPNWWGSSAELGQSDRHPFLADHHSFMPRGKTSLNEKQPVGNPSFAEHDPFLYDQYPTVSGHRSTSDCYAQIMQLHITIQEISQQIRNLNMAVSANKTCTRDALLQHRFDLHNMTRSMREVPDMISESMKRIETQVGSHTRLLVDIESRLRRLEDNQRVGAQKYAAPRESEWQVPGRPDFLMAQDLSFQYAGRDAMRERDNGSTGSMLNNQIPPGTRANNYWDNFRSYSRQNMLSKANANVPQTFSHEASPSSTENSRYSASDVLNNTQPFSVTSDGCLDSSRRSGGSNGGKNLWATSGFYENMSSKKRNKDQKSQTSTLSSIAKSGSTSQTNSNAAEPLRSLHESQPEPDESATISSRETFHTRRSPQISPHRRGSESGPFSRLSDFELPWPPVSAELTRKQKFSSESAGDILMARFSPTHSREHQHHREIHFEDRNPNHSGAPKVEREKHIQGFETTRSSEGFISLDDTRSTNQELLDTTDDNDMLDWGDSRHNESSNTLEGASSTGEYRSPLSSPLVRCATENIVNNGMDQTQSGERRGSSPSTFSSSSTVVPMNIRCEEDSMSTENAAGRNGNQTEDGIINNNS